MIDYWPAFLLGLAGSVHCAGMCGPLALSLPAPRNGRRSFVASRAAYNLGRIGVYCLMGLAFGLLGKTAALAGFQRWLSITAGALILCGLAASSRRRVEAPMIQFVTWLKEGFGALLQRKSLPSLLLLGALNGLLPCGLSYTAGVAAAATGSAPAAAGFMAAFGVGTLPLMLAIGLAGKKVQFGMRLRLQKAVVIAVALIGLQLVLRGLSLGIPY